MKNVQKSIRRLVIEIVLVSCFIVFSYFWWDNLDINKYQVFTNAMSMLNTLNVYEKETGSVDALIPMDDDYAMSNLKPMILVVDNPVGSIKNYNLILRIGKESTLDYNFITVSLDEKIYKLKNLTKLEDDYNIYLVFDEDSVKKSKEFKVRIWLDAATTNEAMDKSLAFDFVARENKSIVAIK